MNPNRFHRAQWVRSAVAVSLLALWGCGGTQPGPAAPESVSRVGIITARTEAVPDDVDVAGTVRAANTAAVAARTMGAVLEVRVREGDRVRRGQLLVQLDDREPAARRNAAQSAWQEAVSSREEAARGVAAAEAHAEVARKTYERFVYLREQKSVSAQEFDEVEAKYRAAGAGLAQARARQQQASDATERAQSEARAAEAVAGYTRVVAPFDGVVVQRSAEPGMMAMPGSTLVVVEDDSRYQMEAAVDAAAAAQRDVRRGTKARVRLDALAGREFAGTVAELEAAVDPASQTLRARIDLPRDPAIRSGLFGRVRFCCGERRALAVPRAAVQERGQLSSVYIVDAQGIARLRVVMLGFTLGERVEVLSGVQEGERIVGAPAGRELDGKKVAP